MQGAQLGPQRFYYGRDAKGNCSVGVINPEPIYAVSEFQCSALPQFRFPIWVTFPDSALFWLRDADLPALCLHLKKQGVHRDVIEPYYALLVHYRGGLMKWWPIPRGPGESEFRVHFGFEGMPAQVAESLQAGEMRKLQAICGWAEVHFHEGTHVPCFGLGCDGSRWYFDEAGRLIEDPGA